MNFFHASIGHGVFCGRFPFRSLRIGSFHPAVIRKRDIRQRSDFTFFRFGDGRHREFDIQLLKNDARQQVEQQTHDDRRLQPLHDDVTGKPPGSEHQQAQTNCPPDLPGRRSSSGKNRRVFAHRLTRSHAQKRQHSRKCCQTYGTVRAEALTGDMLRQLFFGHPQKACHFSLQLPGRLVSGKEDSASEADAKTLSREGSQRRISFECHQAVD